MGHCGGPLCMHGIPAHYKSGGEGVPSPVQIRNAWIVFLPELPCQQVTVQLWIISTTQAPGAAAARMGFQSHPQMVTVTLGRSAMHLNPEVIGGSQSIPED